VNDSSAVLAFLLSSLAWKVFVGTFIDGTTLRAGEFFLASVPSSHKVIMVEKRAMVEMTVVTTGPRSVNL
jgi:hypothetical protein